MRYWTTCILRQVPVAFFIFLPDHNSLPCRANKSLCVYSLIYYNSQKKFDITYEDNIKMWRILQRDKQPHLDVELIVQEEKNGQVHRCRSMLCRDDKFRLLRQHLFSRACWYAHEYFGSDTALNRGEKTETQKEKPKWKEMKRGDGHLFVCQKRQILNNWTSLSLRTQSLVTPNPMWPNLVSNGWSLLFSAYFAYKGLRENSSWS